jgi:hypothetical protein
VLFRDHDRQAAFDENGYVVLDLLDRPRIDRLLDFYRQTVGGMQQEDLFESSRHCSLEMNFRIMDGIRAEFEEPASRIFADGTLFGGTFMVKVRQRSTVLPLHQDWSVVEEDRHQSAFIWCALDDVTPECGGLFVLPGSHRYFHNIRSGNMPSVRIPLDDALAELIVDVPLKAGQAVAYSDRLFHGSRANRTKSPRIVCTGRVNEAGSTLLYYHQTEEGRVAVIEASPEFYLKEIGKLARGGLVEGFPVRATISYRYDAVTAERLLARLAELGKLPEASSA